VRSVLARLLALVCCCSASSCLLLLLLLLLLIARSAHLTALVTHKILHVFVTVSLHITHTQA
jgi:hypothetical protein